MLRMESSVKSLKMMIVESSIEICNKIELRPNTGKQFEK